MPGSEQPLYPASIVFSVQSWGLLGARKDANHLGPQGLMSSLEEQGSQYRVGASQPGSSPELQKGLRVSREGFLQEVQGPSPEALSVALKEKELFQILLVATMCQALC